MDIDAGVGDGACVVLTTELKDVEHRRMLAIQASGTELLRQIIADRAPGAPARLRQNVWPGIRLPEFAGRKLAVVRLVLIPLSRIGQMEGKSGSLVLIGWFEDVPPNGHTGKLPNSHPVVVKTRPAESGGKLEEEYTNALSIELFTYEQSSHFALPLRPVDTTHGYSVLWSQLMVSEPLWTHNAGGAEGDFKVHDLRKPLESGQGPTTRLLESTYELLRNLHNRIGLMSIEVRRVTDEYAWYLRDLGTVWGHEWFDDFGAPDQPTLTDAGEEWVNPFWLVERLSEEEYEFSLGAVHGDLHPGNVIFAGDRAVGIIDFGWARDRAHIAKDFALMECNLRFLTLRPQLRLDSVRELADAVTWAATQGDELQPQNAYLRERLAAIRGLRRIAEKTLPSGRDWDREYLVPLFLVALGLLRFGKQLGNQQAAVRTVLTLARHLSSVFGFDARTKR